MQEDKIISALIGLVGACNNHQETEHTNNIIIKALAFPRICSNPDEEAVQKIVEEIHAEKYVVSPGCAQCAMPCGNTSDYDMGRIYDAEDEICELKLQILSELQKLAERIYCCKDQEKGAEMDYEIFYKALSYISYDLDKETLLAFLEELKL